MLEQSNQTIPEYATRSVNRVAGAGQALDFASAPSVREKARLSAMNPNYWYPAEWSRKLKNGQRIETRFWGQSIALFRDERGEIAAIENRCPHRHLPLTMGAVKNCNLVCAYHGWAFNRDGVLQSVEHDLFGRPLPRLKIRAYPVKERYGLAWIFPGDPKLAEKTPLPLIPNAEGADSWPSVNFDFNWRAHYSMVIDNLCNLCHLYVHGKWSPFDKTWLVHSSVSGERLELVWNHTLRNGFASALNKLFLVLPGEDILCDTHSVYEYPYHSALSNARVRSVNLMLPKSENETRVFTLQYWKPFALPLLSPAASRAVMKRILVPLIAPSVVEVYRQDGATVEAEMQRLDENFFKPIPEMNTSVRLFDKVNSERWQAWLDYSAGKQRSTVPAPQKVLLQHPLDYVIPEKVKAHARVRTTTAA